MIGILGTKRILTLTLLFAVNAVLGVAVYLFLIPNHASKDMELTNLKGEISTTRADIDRMQVEFEQLAAQQGRFNELRHEGFFDNQSRRQAELVFKSIQTQANVIAATANIQAGVVENNEEAQKADYKLLSSPVNIHVDALDPVDVYRYVYLLEQFFPGHISIQNIRLERKVDVSNEILKKIAAGENPALVQADIAMMWHTMVPKSEIIETPGMPGVQGQ